ncbi:MAG: phosphotransferase family protein [Candidatus Dormibacteraeota bacterium]|uniref:Phosphotransferase family protein n=1 Tax=Candidatus Amunia macphersoniae TaxID=3127014 RepID=A0A934KK94_9BACT|nr:phosphotransferase family protein [Candidatus Dormibacteraeota bacterium]
MDSPRGLDLDALAAFLAPRIAGFAGPLSASVIAGGRSNLTYAVTDGPHCWVVRRPPLAHVLPTAHDMAREWKVMSALQGTGIPVPVTVALCEDPSVVGSPFYVMDFVEGQVVRERLPQSWPDTRETRQRMSRALVDVLLALHAVAPASIGLADFGRPAGFLERQVRRWWQQWEASKTRDLEAIEELHRRLIAGLPDQSAPGIVHGDYRFDNVIFHPEDPGRISAVVDWEMSTIGDPLCDLGLLIVYWVDDPDDPAAGVHPGARGNLGAGFFTRDEVIAAYRAGSDRDLSHLEWYIALGHYKLAIIAEGIHARFLMGMTVGEGFETMGPAVPLLVDRALARAAASGLPGLGS